MYAKKHTSFYDAIALTLLEIARTMKPRIFISAVSAEFLELRKQVALILSGLGYEPVVQDTFSTSPGELREMLKTKIDSCDGLIQIVGNAYGYEPPIPDPEFGRCSFTQFEYFYAKQQKKEIWVIHAHQACSTSAEESQLDLPDPEMNLSNEEAAAYQKERRDLQIAYRRRLEAEGQIVHAVDSDDGLALKLNSLKDDLARLTIAFKSWQKWVAGTLAIVVLMLIAGGVYFAATMKEHQEGIDQIATEVKKPNKEWDIEDYRAGLMKVARRTHAEDLKKVDAIKDWEKRLKGKKRAEEKHAKRQEQVEAAVKAAQEGYLSGNVSKTTLEFNRIVGDQGLDEALKYYERIGKKDERRDVEALVRNQQNKLKIKLTAALAAANGYYLKGNLNNTVERCEFILNYHPGWNEVWHLGYLAHADITDHLFVSRGPQAARPHAEKSHYYAILYAIHARKNTTAQRGLSISYSILGDILLKEGSLTDARSQYEQSLKILKELAAADKTNVGAQRDLSVLYERLGNIFLQEGKLTEARSQYEQSLKIHKELAAADKTDAGDQRGLSISYNNLGDILLQEGNLTEARSQYEQSLKIDKELVAADKTNASAQRELSISYSKLGDIFLKEENLTEARSQYEQSLKIDKE
uniref:tetratricopeptide repeat protein n=1 Tax=uncultured Gimesia sp. TaxID=1678688 RepID=UPI00262E7263